MVNEFPKHSEMPPPIPKNYRFVLEFTATGHLHKIEGPSNMTVVMILDHLVVAAKNLVKHLVKEEKQRGSMIIKPSLVGLGPPPGTG
jgi:hypothetical protein